MAESTPVVQPWRRIPLDPWDGGSWIVAGDVDGDGEVEIVTARNVDISDVHYTCTIAAYKLDGTRLWRWGGPGEGRAQLCSDIACQLYDWDGDGRLEVIACDEYDLVELDGATGIEKRRMPLPYGASDCLVFCNLSGGPRATDVLVKNRYSTVWAFDREWRLLWERHLPGGHKTAHQPLPVDLDGDGRQAVMVGLEMLNPDGSTRWCIASRAAEWKQGHLDCCRVVRQEARPEDWRLALTYCSANVLAMIDGTGAVVWELTGKHFESLDVGRMRPDLPGLQLLVDVAWTGLGPSPLWVVSEHGEQISEMRVNNSRFHHLLDWTGSGIDSLVGIDHAIYDGDGHRLATLAIDPYDQALAVHLGNMTGSGATDILLTTRFGTAAYIYRNPNLAAADSPAPLGTGVNVTLY